MSAYDQAMLAYSTARKAYDRARGKKRCPGCGGGAFHYHECPSLFRPIYQPPVTSPGHTRPPTPT
jgi:hypothetical protein